MEKNLRDALAAEMLGDIGKLHDEVRNLGNVLPRLTEQVKAIADTSATRLQREAKAIAEEAEGLRAIVKAARSPQSIQVPDTNNQQQNLRASVSQVAIATFCTSTGLLLGLMIADKVTTVYIHVLLGMMAGVTLGAVGKWFWDMFFKKPQMQHNAPSSGIGNQSSLAQKKLEEAVRSGIKELNL